MIQLVKKYFFFLLIVTLLSASFSGCKTKKNGLIKRTYHNITARYNGLFNGKIKLAEGIETLNSGVVENYAEPLPIIQPLDVAKAKGIAPLMDKVIEKGSVVIQRHKKSKWVDESYLLVGKAYYHKAEFYTALETFEFVYGTFKKNPSQIEALIWIGKTYLQLEKLSEAQTAFDLANSQIETAPKYKKELYAAYAQYYLSTDNTTETISELNKTLDTKGIKKKDRIRYTFILAQLYAKEGYNDKALLTYKKLNKMNAPYEIEFISSMNQASLYSDPSDAAIEKQLYKMLKDEKNKDFRDQIYYALGGIEVKKEKIDEAILLYKLSATNSTKNTNQKGLSFLQIAEINFNEYFNYVEAKKYYDSTAILLNPNHPFFASVISRKNNLDKLVLNLDVIKLQDSLQRIALLPENEREKLLSDLVIQEKELIRQKEEEKKQILDDLKSQTAFDNNGQKDNQQLSLGDADEVGGNPQLWYFYNPQAVGSGYNDFIKNWGKRILEDNWRRSSKISFSSLQPEETKDETQEIIEPGKPKLSADEAAKKKIEKTLPLTTPQLEESNRKIAEAYYNLGSLYREQFNDLPESVKSFEKLLTRYPLNKFTMQTLYTLYRLNVDMKNDDRANYYKNKILNDFPNSNFAFAIKNPGKKEQRSGKEVEASNYYDKTYTAFIQKDYQTVLKMQAKVDTLFPNTTLTPKFDYLKAMAIGKTQSVAAFETALNHVISTFPTDPTSDLARTTLAYIADHKRELESPLYLQRNNPGINYVNTKKEPDENNNMISNNEINNSAKNAETIEDIDSKSELNLLFTENDSVIHYFALAVFDSVQNLNSTRLALSNFNKRYFPVRQLKNITSNTVKGFQLITVQEFKNKSEADIYLKKVEENKNTVLTLSPEKYEVFILSKSNLEVLKTKTDADNYIDFYKQRFQ